MTLSPTFLIYRTGFAPTNGTSVQLQRLFGDADEALVHLMWYPKEAGKESVRWVINTDDLYGWKFPFRRMDRTLRRLRTLTGLSWWTRDSRLNSAKLAAGVARLPLRPRQAYITYYQETEAAIAFQFWEASGRMPFVLHIMDILDLALSESLTPNTVRLVRAAHHVLCLNRVIEDEMKRLGASSTSLFPLCSDFLPTTRTPPPGPLKIVMSGAIYQIHDAKVPALRLLRESWPKLKAAFPGAELHYSGVCGQDFPPDLRSQLHDHGLLPWETYQELLRSSHLAYVPVSHLSQTHGQYSLPSRIPDYLISGLPVIAHTNEGTGIHEFFQSAPQDCTRLIHSADEFLATVQEFAGDTERWKKASDAAISYSKQTFSVAPAREKLVEHLNAAGLSAYNQEPKRSD